MEELGAAYCPWGCKETGMTERLHFTSLHFHLHSILFKKKKVAQSCPILCDPMDCNPLASSVHGFLQARILERVAIPFSRGSSQFRDQTQVSCIAGRFFTM